MHVRGEGWEWGGGWSSYPLVLVPVSRHRFLVPQPLLSVAGQGEMVQLAKKLGFRRFGGQLQLERVAFLLHLPLQLLQQILPAGGTKTRRQQKQTQSSCAELSRRLKKNQKL